MGERELTTVRQPVAAPMAEPHPPVWSTRVAAPMACRREGDVMATLARPLERARCSTALPGRLVSAAARRRRGPVRGGGGAPPLENLGL